MSTGQRIIKNTTFLTTSQIISKFFNFGLIIILTRFLGKEGFGLYSYTFAYVSMFLVVAHLGITSLQVREIAKYKGKAAEILATTFPAVLYLSFFFLILVNSVPFFLNWDLNERLITLVFSFYFMFDSLSQFFLGVTRAYEKMEYHSLVNVVERFLLLISALSIYLLQGTLLQIVIAFASVMTVKFVFSLLVVKRKFVSFSMSFSLPGIIPILKEAYPFALIGLFATVSTRIDSVLIGDLISHSSVGVYNAARKIIEALTFLPESIYYAVFPAISIMYLTKKTEFIRISQKTLLMILIIALPIVSGLFVLAPRIIDVLFEPEFAEAGPVLRWLSILLALIFLRNYFMVILNSVGRQHLLSFIFGISMLVNIVFNYLLIPKYNILGASMAAIISELAISVFCLPILRRYLRLNEIMMPLLRLIFVSVILTSLLFLIRNWNLAVIIMFTALVYISALVLFKIITTKEIKEVRTVFKKKISVNDTI